MKKTRNSGILMHISSLPGDYSIGSLGREAMHFVDLIADAGFTAWQVLPLCMADECHSPYKSVASFSGNPYLIDLPLLYEESLITGEELAAARDDSQSECNYERLEQERLALLRLAASRVLDRTEVIEYVDSRPALSVAAHFLALREANGGEEWQKWTNYECDIDTLFFWQFVQYKFYTQWHALKNYANSRGVSLIGDLPIYVAADSADVWAEPAQFKLDRRGYPTEVSGVPPDYFSEDGQLWGNPLYDWRRMKDDGYRWWRERLSHALDMFDGVRIDHFRALESYWSVPKDAASAKEGKWVKGPRRPFISMIKELAEDSLIIAEDLGDITDEVRELLRYSGFPGMRVLAFAFLGDDNSLHLPHNCTENSIVYTGTHDNNTLLGYVDELDADCRAKLIDYIGADALDPESITDSAVRTLFATCARTVILPIQDCIGLGSESRMNTPGTASGNWGFRLTREQLAMLDTAKFKHLNKLYGR